ncbi:LPXTG cell wall anchor domain-containing protein, partial [Lactiplantibacillus plantarum]|uniref:LPXTG cell wall anchor domain-containing protein n=1 Tax=Lactiplantibacillus plantarum TaxID=1590 RepID=UPI00117AAD12
NKPNKPSQPNKFDQPIDVTRVNTSITKTQLVQSATKFHDNNLKIVGNKMGTDIEKTVPTPRQIRKDKTLPQTNEKNSNVKIFGGLLLIITGLFSWLGLGRKKFKD